MKVVEEVVGEAFVVLEAGPVLEVEPTAVDVANNAGVAQCFFLFGVVGLGYHEAVDYNCEENGYHDCVYDYGVDVFEDGEDGDGGGVGVECVLLEEVADKAVDCTEGGEEDEGEAVAEGVAVAVYVLGEEEVEQDAEEVLQDDQRDH